MKAHLIHCVESFAWHDFSINRKTHIEDFFEVHELATEQGDTIYSNGAIWELEIDNIFFGDILYWDDTNLSKYMPWADAQMMGILADFLGKNPSIANKAQLYKQYADNLCAQIGCYLDNYADHDLIYDTNSWYEKRIAYLSQPRNNQHITWGNSIVLPNTTYAQTYIATAEVQAIIDRRERNMDNIRECCAEILRRNYYVYNQKLSSQEKQITSRIRYIYEIYREGKWQYLSIDVENGLLEFCDEKGEQQGAYDYYGTQIEKRKPDHGLKSIIQGKYKRH